MLPLLLVPLPLRGWPPLLLWEMLLLGGTAVPLLPGTELGAALLANNWEL
jgi:hypothetical protein